MCHLGNGRGDQPIERSMGNIASVVNLARRTLRRLEEQLGPGDPVLKEVRAAVLRAIAELDFAREQQRQDRHLPKTA